MKLRKNGLGGIGAGVALFVVGLGIIPLAYCHDNVGLINNQETTKYTQISNSNTNTMGHQQSGDTINYQGNNTNYQGNNNHAAGQQLGPAATQNAPATQSQDRLGGFIDQLESNPGQGKKYPTGECNPDALAVGIQHFRYDNAKSSDLVSFGSRKLHRDAAASMRQMQADAKRDGVTLTVGSAYRSINYQQGIVNRKKQRGMSDLQIYSASAPAGYSEHSTGYVVDFTPIESSFGNTRAYRWLTQNAHRYNWVQSFTPEVSRVSNVMVEPWHWRYEGTEEARQLFTPRSCYR
ncbi:D-alanyl-D-alanine carboxypeptidase family protein [Psychrobacter sp. FDAARGOS_221]|uniref:M15 family metallopeptidase n=1 Tax=Psychrobacter sp. FDAARGOS_221 TaxID=1975705 RepID=UPI000BB57C46|nr:M15 family metallopeptidase [Psychrobacter sp. FDAARGOS_221]PNK60980.1 hypothetical protein A6J60_008860 [Psychrobacter sp. FDAARGOS_221]